MYRYSLLLMFVLSASNATQEASEESSLHAFGSAVERFMQDEPNPNDLFHFPVNEEQLQTLISALCDNAIPNAVGAPIEPQFLDRIKADMSYGYTEVKKALEEERYIESETHSNTVRGGSSGGTAFSYRIVGYKNGNALPGSDINIYWDVKLYNALNAGQNAIEHGGKGKTAQEIIMDLAPGLKPESPVQLPDDI